MKTFQSLAALSQDYPQKLNPELTQEEISIKIEKMLQEAVKSNDITKEQATILKESCKCYEDALSMLSQTLEAFKQARIDYLMSLSFDELDKTGLMEELKTKFLQGYQQKYFIKFGKHAPGFNDGEKVDVKQEAEALIQFAIDNKDISPEQAAGLKRGFEDDYEALKVRIKVIMQQNIDEMMGKGWDGLDKAGLLERLKEKYFDGFKKLYFEKFAVPFKE